ncbi:MAG: alpha/beta fold hydrolase [Thiolinea sp.]
MKKHILSCVLALAAVMLLPVSAVAKTIVMIPGFQAQGMDWRFNQVTPMLQSDGWVDGGNYTMTTGGVVNNMQLPGRPADVLFTLNLPTTAGIATQAAILNEYLKAIYQRRQEPLTLVGHSAGGVVARHWLVTSAQVPVEALVTIASPHTGTPMAQVTRLLLSNTDILNLANKFGFGHLKDAKSLFKDLQEEKPGNYLYWLNHQPHPAIRYAAIVRSSDKPESVDFIVPEYSQDMNNTYALNGRAERWNSEDGHLLSANDGYLLAAIMNYVPQGASTP